ncbi:rhomboid-related protein 4 isoform X2 [Neoarius graeffei]|uniref:rhomboid-related protein 4 isoform X2 n=1 Tax=Neoarius graeffei TaxID=443677 RepID=UPI00298CC14E|nr:rhomboid-related protein 4 isoform X2 [Neoarius graeffei]
MRNTQRGVHFGLLLLVSQVFQLGTDNIPPATLATIGLNVYLFLFPAKPLLQTCVSVQQVYWAEDWHRLLFSPFHHVDDWHLYFNMVSFLWKGISLERRLGTAWFVYLLSVFSLLTGLVYLLLEEGLTRLLDDFSFSKQCAVGFSGVLFGLKVVNNYYNPGGVKYILGFPVANRYACWVELVLIHILNPGTSFVGHLSGILVGLLYTTGPLGALMKTCADLDIDTPTSWGVLFTWLAVVKGFLFTMEIILRSSTTVVFCYSGYRTPYTSNRSPDNGQDPYNRTEPSAPPQHPYTAGLSEREQFEAAMMASLQEQRRRAPSRPSYGFNANSDPSMEEIRRRRLQRFDR